MVVLFTCKNEEDQIKNAGARVFTTLFHRRARADNSGVGGGIWLKFELSKLSCLSLLPARMKKI